jgi:hypothetical protein
MRLLSRGVLPIFALMIPCALAWVSPASAIDFPDRRASCDRAGVVNPARSTVGASCAKVIPGPAGIGFYRVTFPFAGGPGIRGCTVTGTIGTAGTAPGLEPFFEPGEIALSFPAPIPTPVTTTVLVRTYNSRGFPADRGFRILVSC